MAEILEIDGLLPVQVVDKVASSPLIGMVSLERMPSTSVKADAARI
jgi:hypothetical protein